LHAVFLACLHDPRDLVQLGFPNEIAHGRRRYHNFERGDASGVDRLAQRADVGGAGLVADG